MSKDVKEIAANDDIMDKKTKTIRLSEFKYTI